MNIGYFNQVSLGVVSCFLNLIGNIKLSFRIDFIICYYSIVAEGGRIPRPTLIMTECVEAVLDMGQSQAGDTHGVRSRQYDD